MSVFLYYFAQISKSDVNIPQIDITHDLVQSGFNSLLGLAGAVAVVFIVLGGIKYSSSQGDPNTTRQGKEMIIYSLVGLVVVMLSFAIIQLAMNEVAK